MVQLDIVVHVLIKLRHSYCWNTLLDTQNQGFHLPADTTQQLLQKLIPLFYYTGENNAHSSVIHESPHPTKVHHSWVFYVCRPSLTLLQSRLHTKVLLKEIINSITRKFAQQLSFEWLHTRVSSKDLIVRTTLYSIVPHEKIAQQLSFEWSHTRISCTDLYLRITLTAYMLLTVPHESTA